MVIDIDYIFKFSSQCQAVCYCSENCRLSDFDNMYNSDHSHKIWCKSMKLFMDYTALLSNFPFQYAHRTLDYHFLHFSSNDISPVFSQAVVRSSTKSWCFYIGFMEVPFQHTRAWSRRRSKRLERFDLRLPCF